jgi:tetratricopeptide (TPR) repeat protein
MKKLRWHIPELIFLSLVFYGCNTLATSAEEYFSIGMAYFEMGKYEEAERWLNRAKTVNKTMSASQYNLGRIAFETGRYEDAVKLFEGILKKDPNNIFALKAAAYTRIKMGDITAAEKHYAVLLKIIPDSADDGYNHALVLYAMERYEDSERILNSYPFALAENNDMMLLFARCQKAQDKVEAIDSYAKWLDSSSDPKVRYEYAQLLEQHEFYARAIEEYQLTLTESALPGSGDKKVDIDLGELHFALARALLTADGENDEGIKELEKAVSEGFNNIEAVEELYNNEKIIQRESLRTIINNMQRTAEEKINDEAKNELSETEPATD